MPPVHGASAAGAPQAPSSPAVPPANGAPAAAAPPAASAGSPPLSAESLHEAIRAQLLGESTPTTKPAADAGPKPSPATEAASSAPPGAATDGELTPPVPGGLVASLAKARADKRELKDEIAQRDDALAAAREKIKAMEARLAAVEKGEKPPASPPPAPPPDAAPVSPEVAQLQERVAFCEGGLAWCEANPDGGQIPLKDGTIATVTAEQVTEFRTRYQSDLDAARVDLRVEQRLSSRAQEEARVKAEAAAHQARIESERDALAICPELANPNSPEAAMAAEILRQEPGLAKHPKGPGVLARLILAERALASRQAPAVAPAAPVAPPPPPKPTLPWSFAQPPGLPGASPAMPSGSAPAPSSADLLKVFQKSGNPEDRNRWMQAVMAGR